MRAQLATLGLVLGLACASPAAGSPVTYHWSGPVTGYACYYGACDDPNPFAAVVPLGTTVDVLLTFDPDFSATYNPPASCFWGTGSASFQVLGRKYTHTAYLWNDGYGFSGGICGGGGNEVVVPNWGFGGPELPGDWSPYWDSPFSGFWWGLDPSWTMPSSIASQFPYFSVDPSEGYPVRFNADLHAVPEPSTWLLLATGLAAVAGRRLRSIRRR
jgi:hypothetical protein